MTNNGEYMGYLREASELLLVNRLDEAIDECTKANAMNPQGPEALCMLGIIAFQLGDAGRSIFLLEQAHAKAPDCRDVADALAVVTARSGRVSDSLYYAKLAVALDPYPELTPLIPEGFRNYYAALSAASPSAHYVNAEIHFEAREFELAVEACGKEVRINQRNAPCYRVFGRALSALGAHDQALAAFHAAVHIEPGDAWGYLHMGDSLIKLGRMNEGRACHRHALALAPDDMGIRSKALAALAYLSDGEWSAFAADSKALRERLAGIDAIDRSRVAVAPRKGRIRVGYLSDGFWDSPICHFIEAVLRNHERSRFEVFGYQQNVYHDLSTTRFKSAADHWREIFDVDDDTAANIIARDGVDILVDLCQYGDGQRIEVLARRPAPIQAAWLAWPNGAGLGTIDYVIGDAATADSDRTLDADATCMELSAGLVALNAEIGGFDPSLASEPPAQVNGHVTFGGLCDAAMVTPEVALVWARLLHAVPNSRLLLGNVDAISTAVNVRIHELFSHFGVVDRIVTQPAAPDEYVNLSFYAQVDVVLDTFPVNAAMQACEALLIGIPVVSLAGTRRAAVVGASILSAAGRPQWAAASEDAFVETAAALANDPERLAELRRTLGDEVAKSALCDRAGFTRALEALYERMFEEKGPKDTD